jgi:hypothetical protein
MKDSAHTEGSYGNSADPTEDKQIERAKAEAKKWRDPDCFIAGVGYGMGLKSNPLPTEGQTNQIREFVKEIQNEFKDENWEYLDFIADRFLNKQKESEGQSETQERQMDFVHRCIGVASSIGIRFLLHIDDDELLVLGKKWNSIQEYCASVEWESIQSLRIQNYEAVLRATPTDSHEYFKSTRWFKNCGREPCRSYSNGKSIADVSNVELRVTGCHTFSGTWKKMKEEDGVILHFDSISYPRWKTKFQALSKMSPEVFASVPFSFYKKSIECFWDENKTEQEKWKFWIEWVSHCEFPIDITKNYSIV